MSDSLVRHGHAPSIPIRLIAPSQWQEMEISQPERVREAARLAGFAARAGQMVLMQGPQGRVEEVLWGLGDDPGAGPMGLRPLPAKLPVGDYHIEGPVRLDAEQSALAWALGAYRFDRYKSKREPAAPRLVVEPGVDPGLVGETAGACALARDMINTPANDMGPADIEHVAREMCQAHGARCAVTAGEALLDAGYPAVHAVGRAASPDRAPRMIEITWGDERRPLIALVGKGVVFDSGGLDIKPSAGMRWMKKDMGGAAHAFALARMIMSRRLPVRLAVLTPIVENAIAGDAMRPGDILASRSGLSIEVGNTDAEGRLILADALTRAGELSPALTIDLATLTGAARVALGPQVPPFYTADDALAADLERAAEAVDDPIWRMPLWRGYAQALDSDVADIKNDPEGWAQAGSVTAALFLQRFAPKEGWAHFDIFAWNPRERPGWPMGAEIQAVRAILAMLGDRYR